MVKEEVATSGRVSLELDSCRWEVVDTGAVAPDLEVVVGGVAEVGWG